MGRNLLLSGIILCTATTGIWVLSSQPTKDAAVQPLGAQTTPAAAPAPAAPTLASPPPQVPVKGDSRTLEAQSEASHEKHLLIVDAASGNPIGGISAYVGQDLIGGPTGADGSLSFTPPTGLRTTFWAPGWQPRAFHSRALPAERVELVAATASLEVLVDKLAPGEGILVNRLEPMDWNGAGQALWSAPMEKTAPYRLFGDQMAPGRYQLYVWVGAFQEQGTALDSIEVELAPGTKKVVRLDASVKPDDEVDS